MKRIEVSHILDGTVAVDVIETDGTPNAKIHPPERGEDFCRGYVKVPGREVLYAHVERIDITDGAAKADAGGAQ